MKLPVNYNNISSRKRKLVREEYIRRQNNLCWFCGESLDKEPTNIISTYKVNRALFPPNFFGWPVHLHHDHKTGITKGAVHCYCNAVLWQFFED